MKNTVSSVILTGASGFIGAAVLAELFRRRIRTLVLLRPESDRSRLTQLAPESIFLFSKLDDVGLAEQLSTHKPDIFIHCAWRGVGGR